MGFRCLCVSRKYSPIRLPKQEYGNTNKNTEIQVPAYTFQFFKPGTVKSNNHDNDNNNNGSKKKKMHNQLDSQRHTINSIDDDIRRLTLKDWLLASPVIDKRTPTNGEEGSNICSTKSSTIRIHPSPVQDQDHYISITSAKRFFMEMDSKYDGGGLTTPNEAANNLAAEKKRRVQFKLPELADIISFDPTEEALQTRKRPETQLQRRREGSKCRCSSNCLNLLV